MLLTTLRGTIARRILVNYRIDPARLERLLPPPFKPKLVRGAGMGGICLIRLEHVRPRGLPPIVGLTSENAAHRIAVEWDDGGETKQGVFVPRRDTSSWMSRSAGDRLFPGPLHHARFRVHDDGERFVVDVASDDEKTRIIVAARIAESLPPSSSFASLEDASSFFRDGAIGYSASRRSDAFDGVALHAFDWSVAPLEVSRAESSFFDDRLLFPEGTVELDCALLMRGIEHEWVHEDQRQGHHAGGESRRSQQ